jgi:hypothetical protein
MENTKWKKVGRVLFIFGLTLLLVSWIFEREITKTLPLAHR